MAAALAIAAGAMVWTGHCVRQTDRIAAEASQARFDLAELQAAVWDAHTASVAGDTARFETGRRRVGELQARVADAVGDDGAMNEIRLAIGSLIGQTGGNSNRYAAELQESISTLGRTQRERLERAQAKRGWFVWGLLASAGMFVGLGLGGAAWIHTGRGVVPEGSQDTALLLQQREREARENTLRIRALFERSPIPYEEVDAEGRIRQVNQAVCGLLHLGPEEIIGRMCWDLIVPGEQDGVRAAMLERFAAGIDPGTFECQYQLEDGTHLSIEIRESLLRDDQGKVGGALRSLLDVTERNVAAMAARKASQYAMELRTRNEQLVQALEGAHAAASAKGRFLASVSHELRSPLNGIIGFTELLSDQKLGPISEEQRTVMDDVLSNARDLLALIDGVLDLSRIEAGRMEFHRERHRLLDLTAEVRNAVRTVADKKSIPVNLDVPPDLEAVVDGGRFKQVVYNYLSNAVKFTNESGSVRVSVFAEQAGMLRIEVADTGVGIPAEEMPRLFQEFSQPPYRRRAGQGAGLGLALTRTIIEEQGGSVGARSEPGHGSTFWAVLPAEIIGNTTEVMSSGEDRVHSTTSGG